MPKVQCKDCKWWQNSGRRRLKRGAMFSFSSNYEYTGWCLNNNCARETSGYTGISRGHKMSRRSDARRYCKFFEKKS